MRTTRCTHGQPPAFSCMICDAAPRYTINLIGVSYTVAIYSDHPNDYDPLWGWTLFDAEGEFLADGWAGYGNKYRAIQRAVERATELRLADGLE